MTTATRDATVFAMPSLGADMDAGRITRWRVGPGDHVERGQIIVVVETDKSDIEVEVFQPATVVELLADEGDLVPVGAPIARLLPANGDDAGPAPASGPPPAPVASPVASPVALPVALPARLPADRQASRITPRARRLIDERGLDPASFTGRGTVTGDAVLAATAPTAPQPAPPDTAPPGRADTMRTHIAELMTRSWHEIPHFHLTRRLDLTAATRRLAAANDTRSLEDRIVPAALMLCATARAAAAVPACNGWWLDGAFQPAPEVGLGVVLSLRTGGILVPTIERADRLTPADMMARLSELVQRARQGRLRASDVGRATITVTHLGDRGADTVNGVIHPPQVAIVGFGAVHDAVVVADGAPAVRPVVEASLGGDHRAIDGLTGSRLLARLQVLLDGPILEEL
ncbi:MAG TPA: 2-oxo acid dehydrogenase subunit E2 [Ilumatobacter sp.]